MNFEEMEKKVLEWGRQKGILSESSFVHQMVKLEEEFNELRDASCEENVIDGIGDMLVVLTFIANFYDVNLSYCYTYAYNQIKDRKGKMVNGFFVKDN